MICVVSYIFSESFEDEEKHVGKTIIRLPSDQSQEPGNTQPPSEDEVGSHVQGRKRTVLGPGVTNTVPAK